MKVYFTAQKLVSPLLFLGVGIIIFGVILMLCSIEICSRLIKNMKRVKDPEIDRAKNLHQVKHWMDPGNLESFINNRHTLGAQWKLIQLEVLQSRSVLWLHALFSALIPYGWGQEEDYQDVSDVVEANLYGDKAALVSSRGGAGIRPLSSVSNSPSNVIHPSNSPSQHTIIDFMDESSPHMVLALEMAQVRPNSADITSDIFDESLRYSNIDRPRLLIDRSSPTTAKQWRGEFISEEDRIANLFSPSK